MYFRTNAGTTEQRFGRYSDVATRFSIGRSAAMRLAKEAGAVTKYGKSALCDFGKIEAYLETLQAEQQRRQQAGQ